MLVNGKNAELVKYSKGTYNPQSFVAEIKNRWELTDLQIRMAYLAADLAINAQGVFSVCYESFVTMFQERFKMTVSKPTVVRFFKLLAKIGVLTINAAKRKNNKQSANIYIIEPIEEVAVEEEKVEEANDNPDDYPSDNVIDNLDDNHNITLNKTINKASNIPLNNLVNNDVNTFRIRSNEFVSKYYQEFAVGRWNKDQYLKITNKFIDETIEEGRYKDIWNLDTYVYGAIKNIAYKTDCKHGRIDHSESFGTSEQFKTKNLPFYDWLNE